MKKIVILGSTGSIGTQTVEIVKKYPERFEVVALSAHKNFQLLHRQIEELGVTRVVLTDWEAAQILSQELRSSVSVMAGAENLEQLAALPEADIVVNALVGSVGLDSTLAALKNGKTLALANKESLVAGGELVKEVLKNQGERGKASKEKGSIIPVDSEHNAIFQCLVGESSEQISRVLLTGSGGPFRETKIEEFEEITVSQALAHPRWEMGKKVSIDSATLMNKGLEVIEAHFLFGVGYDRIEVLIHPQSIIHSMVEFKDGSVKAQLAPTDMRLPIQYALAYPERLGPVLSGLDFYEMRELNFEKPDQKKFPCLRLALEAAKEGKTYPAVLNTANELAVEAFLNQKISFLSIPKLIEVVLSDHTPVRVRELKNVKEAERWARLKTGELIEKLI